MDVVTSSYMPGDPRLIEQIVCELKSQGIFDQFRKECIADVDTKPAYQNLRQRVEGNVSNFLNKQKFSRDLNKNQLREQLRKSISESGFLETGVERIVDQVVNPKINSVFLPKVEDVVYRFLGLKKPDRDNVNEEKEKEVNLLPNDLEAVSPESVPDHLLNSVTEKIEEKKEEDLESNGNSLNSSNTKTEDESPPFEPLEENTTFTAHEENSVDSHLSGISGLASHDSNQSNGVKESSLMEISQDISQNSLNSFNSNLSIVTSEDCSRLEICESESYFDTSKEDQKEILANDNLIKKEGNIEQLIVFEDTDSSLGGKELEIITKFEDRKDKDSKSDSRKSHVKHKFHRSEKNEKDKGDHKSKEYKDDKSSKSTTSKDREKRDSRNGKDKEKDSTNEKHKHKKDKDRDRSKDRSKVIKENKEKSGKEKEKSEKERSGKEKEKTGKEKSDKEKTKSEKDRDKDRDKSEREKLQKEKEKVEKERIDKERSKSEKEKNEKNKTEKEKDKQEKNKNDKEKHRSSSSSSKQSTEKSEKGSSSSKKDSSNKDKDKSDKVKEKTSSSKDLSNKHKESTSKHRDSSKDSHKERPKSSLENTKEKDKEKKDSSDSKSPEKHKKSSHKDKSSHHDKKSSSSKKVKEKKPVDDHYSSKEKRNDRRSTDRDSNDGSSKTSRNGSFTESYSQSYKSSGKESTETFSSGSGDSSNSDKERGFEDEQTPSDVKENVNVVVAQPLIKYIKPKFASNIHEAMKIMKIRKQLAKLERQNQLALAQLQVQTAAVQENGERALDNNGLEETLSNPQIKKDLETTKTPFISQRHESIQIEHKFDDKKVFNTGAELSVNLEKIDIELLCKENAESLNIKKERGKTPPKQLRLKETFSDTFDDSPIFKSQELSLENFQALEARLAQEMSNINYNMYGEEDDIYEYSSVIISPLKKRKSPSPEPTKLGAKKALFDNSSVTVDNNTETSIFQDSIVPQIESPDQIVEFTEETVVLDDTVCEIETKGPILECTEESVVLDDVACEIETKDQIVERTEETVPLNDINKLEVENTENAINDKTENVLNQSAEDDGFKGFSEAEISGKSNNVEALLTNYKKDLCNEVNYDDMTDSKANSNAMKLKTKRNKFTNRKSNMLSKLSTISKASKNQKRPSVTLNEIIMVPFELEDPLVKNGKKRFIKMEEVNCKLMSEILVDLQGIKQQEKNKLYEDSKNIISKKEDVASLNDNLEVCNPGACDKEEKIGFSNTISTEDTNRIQVNSKSVPGKEVNSMVQNNLKENSILNNSDRTLENNWLMNIKDYSVVKWENNDNPCYYFEKSSLNLDKHWSILNGAISKLECVIKELSLKIQNNVPLVKKRGRKRKIQTTVNNNKLSGYVDTAEPKRLRLEDNKSSIRNRDSMCNTDVSTNQSFILPLSPAESDKSGEYKKEEAVTVSVKRTGKGGIGSNKRYSSEDLYKPRPVYGSSRRRGAK